MHTITFRVAIGQKVGVRLKEANDGSIFVTQVLEESLARSKGVVVGLQLQEIRLLESGNSNPVVFSMLSHFGANSSLEPKVPYEQVLRILREKRPLKLQFGRGLTCTMQLYSSSLLVKDSFKTTSFVEQRENCFNIAIEKGDKETLRNLAFFGIPERYRSTTWKILLDYLKSTRKEDIISNQSSHFELFHAYKKEFLLLGSEKLKTSRRPERLEGQGGWEKGNEQDQSDQLHKLKTGKALEESNASGQRRLSWELAKHDPLLDTAYNGYEATKDRELREEIWKDVQRTHPGLHFFTEKTYEALERILFIYAKLNPGIRYVQGMNEILAPIAFVLSSGKSMDEQTETDTFFCFCNLMAEIRDLYIKELDYDSGSRGLQSHIDELMKLLEVHDRELADRMKYLQLNPQFFALRWFTTLLARELPETVRLWDSLFADKERFRFLQYVCCAMLIKERNYIMQNDFATCMKLLQQYPPIEINSLLSHALSLFSSNDASKVNLPEKKKENSILSMTKWIREGLKTSKSTEMVAKFNE